MYRSLNFPYAVPREPGYQEPLLPFVSEKLKVGSPNRSWDDFEHPKLRQCPISVDDIDLGAVTHPGYDAATFTFNTDSLESDYIRESGDLESLLGYRRMKQEFLNCALIDMINDAFTTAASKSEQIVLNPDPSTGIEALANLQALSTTELGDTPPRPDTEHLKPHTFKEPFRDCLGWIKLEGTALNWLYHKNWMKNDEYVAHPQLKYVWEPLPFLDIGKSYYAIIYDYESNRQRVFGEPKPEDILDKIKNYHAFGFILEYYAPAQWRERLLQTRNIVPPLGEEENGWWKPEVFAGNLEKISQLMRDDLEQSRAAEDEDAVAEGSGGYSLPRRANKKVKAKGKGKGSKKGRGIAEQY
ncbi:unnamed protein product [Clonostachys chloroleuca]|uniref:Uncharacterized protein n=1 Tax=Clonostachys chloroleuca TaxID=1926264 RepID=A0AA35PY11_9HYPO|nr:unnamed protein product [Clonostachys chloroleuca]